MWPKKFFDSKFFSILSTSAISVIVVFLAQSLKDCSSKKTKVEDELKMKAPYTYVDNQDKSIYKYVDTQDANTINYVDRYIKESEKREIQSLKFWESIDRRLNDLQKRKNDNF